MYEKEQLDSKNKILQQTIKYEKDGLSISWTNEAILLLDELNGYISLDNAIFSEIALEWSMKIQSCIDLCKKNKLKNECQDIFDNFLDS
jgi:hypothetical protein